MRRTLILALAALIAPGLVAPAALAQVPPTPKVTINGLIDNMMSLGRNTTDLNYTDTRDNEWYARTRGRFDISGEIGRAKGVLGLEIDAYYGLTGFQDNATTNMIQRGFGQTGQGSGATSAFDMNTDVVNNIEVKWLYVEFPLPLIPIDSRIRVGAQPFATTYKVGALATGDAAGVNLVTTFTPNVRWHLDYRQIEERLSGAHVGDPLSPSGRLSGANLNFFNGDDYAIITSVEVTPMKGLDLRPIYAYYHAEGITASNARVAVGQLSPLNPQTGLPTAPTPQFCQPVANCTGLNNQSAKEHRHTIGIDTRFTKGPFSFRPTFMYQFGTREQVNPFENQIERADISAWLADVITGFRVGPVLLEMRGIYSSGNRPKDQLWRNVNYYQPINTDTSYGADGWGNIFALGIDYFRGAIRTLGTGIGWDRYGRGQVGLKGTYSFTPALDTYVLAQGLWTAKSVDTDETFAVVPLQAAAGTNIFGSVLVPNINDPEGDSNYIGTELTVGLTWRFAPGLTLDMAYAHLFPGNALRQRQNILGPDGTVVQTIVRDPKGADTGTIRVRYTF